MRIAVDAMGSDRFPQPEIEGAIQACRTYDDTIVLVGDEVLVAKELSRYQISGLRLEIAHAPEIVLQSDKPGEVGKSKPKSSMMVGLNLVRDSRADAFVTAGNTGAAMVLATLFTLKRISGVKRPALTSILKLAGGRMTVLLDIGANTDSRPEWLRQFATMGDIYCRHALGLSQPRIALLANGEEDTKGNQLIHEAASLIRGSRLNFIGNVEPKEVLSGAADVVVSDGFVGNITIKALEAMGATLVSLIRDEIRHDPFSIIGGLLARGAFERVRRQIDPFAIGGAPLLGVDGVVIIGHGRSNGYAISNAIGQARKAVDGRVIAAIANGIAQA